MADESKNRPVNDRREGIVRDPVNWQGQIVSYVKDVGNGDPGYNANLRQVVIMLQDGTEKVVPETEILRGPSEAVIQQMSVIDRRPEETMPKALAGIDEGGNDQNRQARAPATDRSKGTAPQTVTTVKPATATSTGVQTVTPKPAT